MNGRYVARSVIRVTAWAIILLGGAGLFPLQNPAYAGGPIGAETITFEPPDFAAGPVAAPPWEVPTGQVGLILTDIPHGDSQCVGVNSDFQYWDSLVRYPITPTDGTSTTVISAWVRPPNYVPGSYDAGYLQLAHFGVYNTGWDSGYRVMDALVSFRLEKPYGAALQPGHYQLFGNGVYMGTFLPGAYHQVILTWDWTANTIDIEVNLPNGTSYSRTAASDGLPLAWLGFAGGDMYYTGDYARFDDVTIEGYDITRPTGSVLINGGAASTDTAAVTLNLSAVDGGGSGIKSMRFHNGTAAWSSWEPYRTTKAWVLASGAGSKTVYAQFTDKAGNFSDSDPLTAGNQPYSAMISYLPTPPVVSGITPTNDTTPVWSWVSGYTGVNGTFRYKLDNNNLTVGATTTTGTSYTPGTRLSPGAHTLYVQERDDVGNTWSAKSSKMIVIDITPPETTLKGWPANPTKATTATFRFTTSGGSTFQCRLDSGAYEACVSPRSYSGLGNGTHTFKVKAFDAAGNGDPTPAAYTWVVDTTLP